MAAIPFMPLYVADYLSDAAHLSTLEHGAYLLLIMTYWQRGEALPADDKKLARICRIGPREWTRMKPTIAEFFQVDCSTWRHKRIDSELQNVRAKSLKKREGGLARAKQMHGSCSTPAKQSDTEADTETEEDKKTPLRVSASDDARELVDDWNSLAGDLGLPKVAKLTDQRRRHIKTGLRTNTLEEWQSAFRAVRRSRFLQGENKTGWKANFDFLLQPSSFAKLIEGYYDGKV